MHSFCFCMHFCFLVEKWILSGYKHRNWWSIWVEYDLMRYCIFPTRELKPRKFCYAILLSSSRSRFSRARKQSVKYDLGQFPIYEIYKKRLKGFFSILLFRASKFWRENSNLQGVPTSFRWEFLVEISNLREIFCQKNSSNWNEICTV